MPKGTNVLKDQVVCFHAQAVSDREHFFRIVEIWDEENQRSFTFLTNNFDFNEGNLNLELPKSSQ